MIIVNTHYYPGDSLGIKLQRCKVKQDWGSLWKWRQEDQQERQNYNADKRFLQIKSYQLIVISKTNNKKIPQVFSPLQIMHKKYNC